jgi:hypothetical protein
MILSVTQGQLEGDTLGNRNQTKKPQFNAL